MEEKTILIDGKRVAPSTYDHLVFNKKTKKSVKEQFDEKLDKEEAKTLYVSKEGNIQYTQEEKDKLAGLNNYDDKDIKEQLSEKVNMSDLTEWNVSILCPTWGLKSDGSEGGNLYTQETAIAAFQRYITENAQLGIQKIVKGKIISFYDYNKANNDISKYMYNGTDWDELWMKKGDFIDDKYIKDELINPLCEKAKGVYCKVNAFYQNAFTVDLSKDFSFELYISADNLPSDFEQMILTNGGADFQLKIPGKTNGIRVVIKGSGNNYYKDKLIKNKFYHIVVSKTNGAISVYINGVLQGVYNFEDYSESKVVKLTLMQMFDKSTITYISSICRQFNYALSADEVAQLYNNGRPDKYVLGNEYKGISNEDIITFNDYKKNKNSIIDDNNFLKIENDIIQLKSDGQYVEIGSIREIKTKIIRYKISITAKGNGQIKLDGAGKIIINVDSEDYTTQTSIIFCRSSSNFGLMRNSVCDIYISDINIQEVGCIGEYIPSSLTQKIWRDTSGQDNDLIASGTPELIYEEPYKETIIGDGAPSVIPDFINQSYIDTTNKKKYCAMGTKAITDWIAVN